MRVTFLMDHGVFSKGNTYEIPDWVAKELIAKLIVVEATFGTSLNVAQKVMRPSQVKQR